MCDVRQAEAFVQEVHDNPFDTHPTLPILHDIFRGPLHLSNLFISPQTTGKQALGGDSTEGFLSGKEVPAKKRPAKRVSREEHLQRSLDANFRIMEQIRGRVDAVVHDPDTARSLKPYYKYGCKRPTFHDTFLPTFNLPHVTLIDTAPTGVSSIDENGVNHNGHHYPLDIIVYATGFQWMAAAMFGNVRDANGVSVSEKWKAGGTKTYLGVHTAGYPNLFVVAGPQGGGGSFNFTETLVEHADYVVWMLSLMREKNVASVDVTPAAETAYAKHCADADTASAIFRDCFSYFNTNGAAAPGALAYYGTEYAKRTEHAKRTLEGFVFTYKTEARL